MAAKISRECGTCTACCQVMIVPELNKPANQACQYADDGCTMYEHRPPTCKDWDCLWIKGEFRERDRPDKIGFVPWMMPAELMRDWKHHVVAFREIKEGATVLAAAEKIIKKFNKVGISVIVIRKETGRAFYPAKGFAPTMRASFQKEGMEYKERSGAFFVDVEFCKKAWPADYADESNLKELIQIT